ncbi:uncharacterized protein LOC123295294 [Chrysoperla carnea]|uniref:uncharacterized protein LOC123295294 n=1 Tax=Chrysoperla carnea TaxID=189513 RepID=UPI001D0639F1|nr:uncharacterized protein LOC123295294 [Chrysoperla carnea]
MVIAAFSPVIYKVFMENSKDILLPFEAWFPYNIHESWTLYGFSLVFQLYATWMSLIIVISLNTTMFSLMVKINGLLQYFGNTIVEKIDTEKSNYHSKFKENMHQIFNTLQIGKDVELVNSRIYSGHFLPEWINLVINVVLLTSQVNNIHAKIASLNWYNGSKEFKQNLLLALTLLNKEIPSKLFGVFPLRLSFFIQILRTSYSMYTVLDHFTKK